MKLEKYISDLLYRYDCVILPDFGAFIANRISTQIIASENKIIPPSKEIIFNRFITNNDGLLIHYVMNSKKLSYEKAEEFVRAEISIINNSLNKGEVVELNKIGSLKKIDESNIEFSVNEEVNYLKSSYGLSTINASTISKEQEEIITIERIKPIVKSIKSKKSPSSIMRYAAVAIPFLTLASLVYYHQINEFNINLSSAKISILPNKIEKVEEAVVEKKEDTASFVEELKVEEEKAPEFRNYKYHIIAGAFSQKKNAEKIVRSINKSGYDSKIIAQNNNGLYLVAYSSFENILDAKSELSDIKNDTKNNSVWIWKKSIKIAQ